MLRLLNIEFIKLWNHRSSRLSILAYFVLLTSIALIATIKFHFGPFKFHLADQGLFDFPYIWHFNTYTAATFKFFLAIVIVSMMANEYSNKTIKQNLIDGLSKKEFIGSKFLTVTAFSLLSTIFVLIMSLILGFMFSDKLQPNFILKDTIYLLAFFIKLLGFFSFCLFLGILIKRSAFALGALFIWFITEKIGLGILNYKMKNPESLSQFFPLEAMANLIEEPTKRLGAAKEIAKTIGTDISYDYAVHWYEIAIVIAWTSIFIYCSYALLQKRDL